MVPGPKLLKHLIKAFLLVAISYHIINISVHLFDLHKYKKNNLNETKEGLKGFFGLQTVSQNGNKSKQCESCSITVPRLIIQYGTKRTATTLQFQIACLMMALLHEGEINNVGCYFNNNKSKKYTVMKTHDIVKLPLSIPSNSWVFMTSSDAMSLREKLFYNYNSRKLKERNVTIPYVADVELVSKRGYYIAYEYQSLFGMSDENMQHIVEYLRYWDILRLCCGRQMSEDWRHRLLSSTNHTQRRHFHNPAYHACEMYNISQVEHLLLNTYIFKNFGHIVSLSNVIAKTSIGDGKLNGSFCERCNANIIAKRLKFNYRCA